MSSQPSTNWQEHKQTVLQRTSHLQDSGALSDVTFIVGKQRKRFLCHRLVFAMSSEVFEAMFFGGVPQESPVYLPDCTPEAFSKMLNYMYKDDCRINSMGEARELCYVATKYMIPSLVSACSQYIWSSLNHNNVCSAFEFAKLHGDHSLRCRCLQLIDRDAVLILDSEDLVSLQPASLTEILSRPSLQLHDEMAAFTAALRWARARLVSSFPESNRDHPETSVCSEGSKAKGVVSKKETSEDINHGGAREKLSQTKTPSSPQRTSVQPGGEKSLRPGCEVSASAQVTQSVTKSSALEGEALRKCLEGVLCHIRFTSMEAEDFVKFVASTGILSNDEIAAIMMNKIVPGSRPYPSSMTQFNLTQPRRNLTCLTSQWPYMTCARSLGSLCHVTQDFFSTSFAVDRSIYLTGLRVVEEATQFSGSPVPGSFAFSIVISNDQKVSIAQHLHKTVVDPRGRPKSSMDVEFDSPVFIDEGRVYSICVSIKFPVVSLYRLLAREGTGERVVVAEDTVFTFRGEEIEIIPELHFYC